MSEQSEPSQAEANKVLRVLKGARGKITCTLHLPDGRCIEWQADNDPKVEWNQEARGMWLFNHATAEQYGKVPMMQWIEGAILLCEKNPE